MSLSMLRRCVVVGSSCTKGLRRKLTNSDIPSVGCPLTETGLLPAHSAATLDMAASPAHTLIMEKHHTLSPTQEKQDKLNITLLVTRQTQRKRCKIYIISETKRTLRECFKEHRQAKNNPLHVNATAVVRSHFNQPGHSIADMELITLELQPTLSMSRQKAREACLIHRGKTLSPDGLNRGNEN